MSQPISNDAAPPPVYGAEAETRHSSERFWPLMLGSIGVVFGDIGTSPLYSLKTAFGQLHEGALGPPQVIGVVSLIIWALLLVVTGKYVLFLMQADNKGEGGTLSLVALAQNAVGRRTAIVFLLGLAGSSLFLGDAMITPAISVLSALEGLNQVDADLARYVLPATIVVLVLLFVGQSRGTARVATFFSPIMIAFFAVNAALGLTHIASAWNILQALSPIPGVEFLYAHGTIGFVVLGSVFLAVTGAEALYADMGHFGRGPIQAAWLLIILPALVCNYLGQGALILTNPAAVENPFYLMAPSWALVPLILLSTAATVIASQAVITGAYSLTSQAIQLGLLPRLEIVHTSSTQEGQIFIPRVNRIILVGVLALVLLFRTSEALGNAYGIAVSGTMVVDTSLAFFVVWKLWRWSLGAAAALAGVFLVIDVGFFFANLYKVVDGGWVPLTLGTGMFILMWTWSRGSAILLARTHRDSIPMLDLIKMLEKSKPVRVPGTAVFLTNDPTSAPSSLMHNLKHNKVLHERVVLLNVRTETTPRVAVANRYEMTSLSPDFMLVTLHFGYMEQPHIPRALAAMRKAGLKFDIMTTSFFLGRRTLKTASNSGMPLWQDKLFIAMTKQAASAPDFFNLPSDRVVELGAQMKV